MSRAYVRVQCIDGGYKLNDTLDWYLAGGKHLWLFTHVTSLNYREIRLTIY